MLELANTRSTHAIAAKGMGAIESTLQGLDVDQVTNAPPTQDNSLFRRVCGKGCCMYQGLWFYKGVGVGVHTTKNKQTVERCRLIVEYKHLMGKQFGNLFKRLKTFK
eukprot:713797-Amphidinium_carterae.2